MTDRRLKRPIPAGMPALLLVSAAIALASAAFAATPDSILAANKAASGNWSGKTTLKVNYAYSGQGLNGTSSSLEDLQRGAFVDAYDIPPQAGATGFDGTKAWEKEPSGTVTDQAGGDAIPLAITEAYQDQNLWWRADRGGATITDAGQKIDGGKRYDVLTVTPRNGTALEAWFDPKSHLLFRTLEMQDTTLITNTYSDYAPVDGAMIAKMLVVDDGSHNLQTFTLMSATFLGAQALSAYQRPAENLHDFSIAGGAHEITVPFHLWNNHIYADVSVNGSKPMTFIFDTGGHSLLMPATAKEIGVMAIGEMTATGSGADIATSAEATVKSITVGGATITNQPLTVLTFSPPPVEGVNEKGMVGYEFFARFVTRIDYGKHTITFIDKRYFDPKSAGAPIPMRLFHQFPEVLGSYDGISSRFNIDTGARGYLVLNKVWAAENGFPKPGTRTIESQTGWGAGGPTRGITFKGGTLKLGNVVIAHPLTVVSTDKGGSLAVAAYPSNVGGGVLKRFVVTFDYDHSTLYLKPLNETVEDLDTFDRSGMWINSVPDGLKVIDVTRGGPAEAAGLQKEDVITIVDGKPASCLMLPDLRKSWRDEAPGTVVKLTVKRGSGTRDIAFTLKDLI